MDTLRAELKYFTKYLIEFFSEPVLSKFIETRDTIDYKIEIDNFEYNENGAHIGSSKNFSLINKVISFKHSDIENELLHSREIKRVLKVLTTEKQELFIKQTIKGIVRKFELSINKKITIDKEYIYNTLFNDLTDGLITCRSLIFLQGLSLESERIDIADNIRLRQVNKDDFENVLNLENIKNYYPNQISACLEIEVNISQNDIYNNVDLVVKDVLIKLTLLTSGSVRYVYEFQKYESLTYGYFLGRKGLIDANWYGLYTHFLNKGSEDNFYSLFHKISIPKYFLSHVDKTVNEITIAYDHYIESVLNRGSLEKRIANIVMGYEALMSDSNTELKFKITNRISKLSHFLEESNSIELRTLLKHSYDFRSIYAHGSNLGIKGIRIINNEFGGDKEYLKRLNRILGKLIIIFLKEGINKEDLISLIDDSFIDEESNKDLIKYIEN